ncbi:hypothetical protein [Prescottella sp. R16]|uniref:hypothetical protein n=1 Tax=Prescottella sp. R16 TaxID=3064529 RepID=UPI00272EB318|nr:hypothetical protein [Prescottella sp. R16]
MAWLDALDQGLYRCGYGSIDRSNVVAPRYNDLLRDPTIRGSLPSVTYKSKDDGSVRRQYERRRARIQRKLQKDPTVKAFGLGRIPEPAAQAGSAATVWAAPGPLEAVKNYVTNEKIRGAVLAHILEALRGVHGDIVLVAHGLGSVIAIDLLGRLPETLRVRRFVTIGSPAHSKTLHKDAERLLEKFPYARVDDWSNFLSPWDPVTMGRGLASLFPAAQDFTVRLDDLDVAEVVAAGAHDSTRYLQHDAIAGLIGDAVWPTPEPTYRGSADIAVRLGEGDALRLLVMEFNRLVANQIEDKDARERFTGAAQLLRDEAVDSIRSMIEAGRPVPAEFRTLVEGRMPMLPLLWTEVEAVRYMAVLATANNIAPYEIDCGDAPFTALPHIAMGLGLSSQIGDAVKGAVVEVRRSVLESRSLRDRFGDVTAGRWVIGALGVALLAAAPIGLMVAAPVGLAGGAAFTSMLAAFGPGGMAGGLAMVGGLASTGTLMATVAATVGSTSAATEDPRTLVARVAAEYALKKLNLEYDRALWERIVDRDNQINAEINSLEPFSDQKSPRLAQLRTGHEVLERLMAFMSEKGLGPVAIAAPDGDPDAVLAGAH